MTYVRKAALAFLALTLTLTGCAPMPTGTELISEAKDNYTTFIGASGEVQTLIWSDEWRIPFPDLARSCDDNSYYFSSERRLPVDGFGEWRIDGGPAAKAEQIAAWLREHGYTVDESENTAGIAFTAVTAKNASANIAEIYVQLFPGVATDTVTVTSKSTCFPGDPSDVSDSFHSGTWNDIINQTRPGTSGSTH